LGIALNDKGQSDEAVAAYWQAVAIDPDLPASQWNLALALLVRGDFAQGWGKYEWRRKCADIGCARPDIIQQQWHGEPLEGRTILLHAEQGFGDTIQFMRYLPLVVQCGGRVIVECQSELQRLLKIMAPDIPIIARGQPLPDFDLQCPLLSVPKAMGTTLATIPAHVPYLRADAQDMQAWRNRLADHGHCMKVGLIWAGNPRHKNDRNRSMKLAHFAHLAQVQGVQFYNLQKGEAAAEAKTFPLGMALIDWTDELKDFADTAGLIANLDLVIAVDTAVAHLAGAMGKPVWTLLPFCPDWRWLRGREDSPWYPTMRLFRQPANGDWNSVMKRVAEALASFPQAS